MSTLSEIQLLQFSPRSKGDDHVTNGWLRKFMLGRFQPHLKALNKKKNKYM